MRYPADEKLEIIRLVEQSVLPVRRTLEKLGIARALMQFNAELRGKLKSEGLVTRDSRGKERKKYGQKGARKRFQFSKR